METTQQKAQQHSAAPRHQGSNRQEWETAKEFQDQESGLTVEVRVLKLRLPQYSIQVCQLGRNGQLRRFITPEISVNNAVASVKTRGLVLARLLDEATLWIQERVQEVEDQVIADKQYQEYRQLERQTQGPKVQPGLSRFTPGSKTEREREAGKVQKHEQNVAARQDADRSRTQNTKGRSK